MEESARDLQYYVDIWERRRHGDRPIFTHTKEMWDQRAKEWVNNFGREKGKETNRKRMLAIADHLRGQGLLQDEQRVIDVGCGPGYYVAEFARTAAQVTGTDLSDQMLVYAAAHAKDMGVCNVDFVQADFAQADIDALGWRGAFDLVFSSITPAFSGIKALEKMHAMSRGWCFNNGWVSRQNTLKTAVRQALFPDMPADTFGNSVYALFNILWLTGKRPQINYYREVAVERLPVDRELARYLMASILPPQEVTEQQTDDALALLQGLAHDGMVEERVESIFSWMLWHI